MKNCIILFFCIICGAMFSGCVSTIDGQKSSDRRKIALQCYTFKNFTFEETLAATRNVGFDALEGTPAQIISAEYPVKITPEMSDKEKTALKNLLKKYNQRFVSYGVVAANSEAEVEKYCMFAKEFGIGAILTEDRVSMFPIWQKMGEKYGIKMYVHHHTDESRNQYFDPDVMMKFVSKYPNIMANPDNGHWSRCSINSVEGFAKLRGEIGSIHLKDQRKFGERGNFPVPYGEGELELKKVLRELDGQNYDGYFVVEYEADWDDPLPAVEKCVKFLRNN